MFRIGSSTPESTKLILLVRDLNCLFAYWEITPQFKHMVMQHFSLTWENMELRLRLNELGNGVGAPIAEFVVSKEVSSQYVEVPEWCRLRAELGFSGSGGFVMLLSSNIVTKYDRLGNDKSVILPPISPLGISSGFRS